MASESDGRERWVMTRDVYGCPGEPHPGHGYWCEGPTEITVTLPPRGHGLPIADWGLVKYAEWGLLEFDSQV